VTEVNAREITKACTHIAMLSPFISQHLADHQNLQQSMIQSISAHGNEHHNEKVKFIAIHCLRKYNPISESCGDHVHATTNL
jgi:hypothetical protein